MIPVSTLWHYLRTRRLHFRDRRTLVDWQQRQLRHFARRTLSKSPWFSQYSHQPLNQWPLMDKALMMAHFDQMNTAGLQRDALLDCARQGEQQRDFSARVQGFSVGLSSGTSGQRGLFVVSEAEQRVWAGGMLAKMLPDGLRAGERVALFLRADNRLYHSVDNRWLTLAFFDLFAEFNHQLAPLAAFAPTIIVAPAQVLRQLALAVQRGQLSLKVKKVISVAEVLEHHDRQLLQQVFGDVGEVYQATEGFLAASCRLGTLHLNEEFIHVEPQWLDERRFVPIITDFTRHTQPIVRYRLDDVLVAKETPCACGQVTRALSAIEGRCDDWLQLADSLGKTRIVFADLCSRAIANALPITADYRLIQCGEQRLILSATVTATELSHCRDSLQLCLAQQGVDVSRLEWQLIAGDIPARFTAKKRRITRLTGEKHD